ncbi:BgTH12-05912 [Blumeria graminis f. sp. triticale]|uniref:BgtA-21425 n=3 Tax=Blumeria graminis TaxID=34373 RepID=A0A9X9MKI4_BLUGR|nr:hypothetical protein BGT96224_A21425 [Blumeria graminis f. sp. tritici 96224]CAD6504178.1 BgTH12-05912 [Blumeria graminis f. sp. triticale]VDB90950.1 BgtA-21425 [Blumeria graminis f. sp. tritici]
MNRVEYSMNNDQTSERQSVNYQYHCQQTSGSSVRDGMQYDPVHESREWFQGTLNAPNRNLYTSQSSISFGQPQSSIPIPIPIQNSSYQLYQEELRPNYHSQDPSYAHQITRAPLETPWGQEFRGISTNPYHNQTNNARENHVNESTPVLDSPTQFTSSSLSSTSLANPHTAGPEILSPPTLHVHEEVHTQENLDIQYSVDLLPDSRNTNQVRQERNTSYPNNTQTNMNLETSSLRRRNRDQLDVSGDDDNPHRNVYVTLPRRQNALFLGPGGLGDERSLAVMRGALAACKRVPSKETIASLEIVNLDNLKATDRTCIICYNEFGIENPEGQSETPLRLPVCKHLFGDKCIRKWFENSDSCPYCRSKLPSELSMTKTLGLEAFRTARERMNSLNRRVRIESVMSSRNHSIERLAVARSSNMAGSRTTLEYEQTTSGEPSWGNHPNFRSSIADSLERRRLVRGRTGSNRILHSIGRTNSNGSGRAITFNGQLPPYFQTNSQGTGVFHINNTNVSTPEEPVFTFSWGEVSGSNSQIPSQNWRPNISGTTRSTSPEIGPSFGNSGSSVVEATRISQLERLNEVRNEMRRSLDDVSNSLLSDLNTNSALQHEHVETDSQFLDQNSIQNTTRTFPPISLGPVIDSSNQLDHTSASIARSLQRHNAENTEASYINTGHQALTRWPR